MHTRRIGGGPLLRSVTSNSCQIAQNLSNPRRSRLDPGFVFRADVEKAVAALEADDTRFFVLLVAKRFQRLA